MNRREFGRIAGIGVLAATVGGSTIALDGCNVWTEIEQWLPTGIAAFESVVVLVAPLAAPGIDAIAEAVKAAFAVLSAAVDQYRNAPADQKATFLQKVTLAFELVSSNLQQFLSAINVASTNPIIAIVLGLVKIILSTIMGFVNRIAPSSSTASRSMKMGGQSITVTPVLRSRAKFKADFNSELVAAGHPELQVN